MKTTTVTKYETSDGREFKDKMDARGHEVCLLADKLRADPNKRLTAVQLVQTMCENPDAFASLLQDFYAEAEVDGEDDTAMPVFESRRDKPSGEGATNGECHEE